MVNDNIGKGKKKELLPKFKDNPRFPYEREVTIKVNVAPDGDKWISQADKSPPQEVHYFLGQTILLDCGFKSNADSEMINLIKKFWGQCYGIVS